MKASRLNARLGGQQGHGNSNAEMAVCHLNTHACNARPHATRMQQLPWLAKVLVFMSSMQTQ
jgi:hypothetical protein